MERFIAHIVLFFFFTAAGVSKTVFALFTDIIGFEVNDIHFDYNDTTIYQVPLSNDVSMLLVERLLKEI